MKRFFIIFIMLIFSLYFSACQNKSTQQLNSNKNIVSEISKVDNAENYNEDWSKEINKSEILEFFKEKDIYLTTLKNIKIKHDEFLNATHLLVDLKEIKFIDFLNYFNLPSNKNIKFNENISTLTIIGTGKGIYH